MTDVDVAVIGAGCGGLTAASAIAAHGRQVVVFDQNDTVGGCVSSFEREGYTFDVGASIFEVLAPLEWVFAALGTTIADELGLIACDPSLAVILRDDTRVSFRAADEGCLRGLATLSAGGSGRTPVIG